MTDARKNYLFDNMLSYIVDVKDHDTDDLICTLAHIGFTKEEIFDELDWLDDGCGNEWAEHLGTDFEEG